MVTLPISWEWLTLLRHMQESEARQREREAAEAAQRQVFDEWQAALPALLPHLVDETVGLQTRFCSSCATRSSRLQTPLDC